MVGGMFLLIPDYDSAALNLSNSMLNLLTHLLSRPLVVASSRHSLAYRSTEMTTPKTHQETVFAGKQSGIPGRRDTSILIFSLVERWKSSSKKRASQLKCDICG